MTEQGTIYIQGWSNGVQELSDFSDIYVSCKYGWKDTSLGTVTQTGTITNKSLNVVDSFDFITFEGDSHTITATWDDEQYIGVVPVIYDVILTYSGSSPKLNKLSFDPTNDGWTVIGDCETVDQGINSGYAIEFSNPQKEIHVETQTDKKAWSTTEPYFGTGVIADGAYYNSTENIYIVIDGTNHSGQLSFSSTTSWEPANTRNYSKQTSGSMFYTWDYNSITQCSGHNRYTWDPSDVYLCYDNTTTLTVDGNTYTLVQPVYENTVIFTGATVSQVDIYADNGEGYVTFNVVNNTIQFDDGDYWMMKNLRTTSGTVSAVTSTDPNGDTLSNSITNPNATLLSLNEIPGTWTIDIDDEFPYDIPNLTGRRFGNAENFESWYFTTQNVIHYQNGCDAGATSLDLNITAWIWDLNAWPGVGWTMQTDGNVEYYYDPAEDKFYDNYADYYPEISYDPCVGPTPTQYSIYTSVIGQGSISGNDSPYYEGDTATLTAVPASGWTFDYWTDGDSYQEYYDNPLELTMNSDRNIAVRFRNTPPPVETYTVTVNVTGQGTTTGAGDYEEGDQVTLTASPSTGWEFNSWQINGTVVETNSTYQFTMGNQDVTITAVFEEEVEKHIYLCDNSGAHLAEMTKTGSTWNATGSFTSGMYSIRATVEGEYEDAWFKFYQTSGDNRIFVGAGDDPSFEDIGTYIYIDNILTSFSLTEDQETGYYVVTYQNTEAMTVSTVETIVNSYIGDFVTGSEISAMGYMTATDISSMGYMTATDISAMSYVDTTTLNSMSYVDQTSLSSMSYVDITSLNSMSYVDNSYLSTYMNSVVGDINAILQTI